jgi:hypothetical protein
MMGINITKFLQIQLGGQIAFLLSGKADSTSSGGASGTYNTILGYYNKIDYGFTAGAEIHPAKGLLIGARYNISLNKLYSSTSSGTLPSFSAADAKNNVVQIFAGWIFGNSSSKKNKK